MVGQPKVDSAVVAGRVDAPVDNLEFGDARAVAHHLLHLSLGVDVVDGTVAHTVCRNVTDLVASIGCHLSFEGQLDSLYLVEAFHNVLAPPVVEDAGIVVCETDGHTLEGEGACASNGAVLCVYLRDAQLTKQQGLLADNLHRLQGTNVVDQQLRCVVVVYDEEVSCTTNRIDDAFRTVNVRIAEVVGAVVDQHFGRNLVVCLTVFHQLAIAATCHEMVGFVIKEGHVVDASFVRGPLLLTLTGNNKRLIDRRCVHVAIISCVEELRGVGQQL